MPHVRTVLGDVPPSALGPTNAHEHLLIRDGLIVMKFPDFRLDNVEKSIDEARDFQRHGGGAIVDTAPIGVGRDPDGLARVARESGLHVVACTGFHKALYYLDSHWRFHYSVDEIASLFITEITVGMDRFGYEGPIRKTSQARAGLIKCASDYQMISDPSRVGFEAAAAAHAATGAPVITHAEMGTMMLEQVNLLHSHGVDPSHIIVSHADRNPDVYVHRDLAQSGAFLEYDCAGRVKYFPESTLVDLMTRMFAEGFGGQILLGGDSARRSYWKAYGGGPGLAYVQERFVPRLRREGFHDDQIRQVLVDNPARALTFRPEAS